MTPVHVGVAGQARRDAYEASAKALLEEYPHLDGFAALVVAALPGTNAHVAKVELFDRAGAIIDARSLAIAAAGGDIAKGLAEFVHRQGKWFVRRQAFEDLWVNGRSFVYFTANPGTPGATDYGEFCLVIDDSRVVNDDSAIFPFDTAQRYSDSAGTVNAPRAFDQVACWDSRADVAITELAQEAAGAPADRWPDLICGLDRYLEVVTVGPIMIDQVTELRLTQDKVEALDELWWDWQSSLLADPAAVRMAKAYDAVMKWPNLAVVIV